ncbi:hypothetical protein [Tunicatimonas pelagia]|uniref:hypothetical protein n=1 Tax=Tunicatimonas pelagia TaxID=931531 RepID=UPI0026668794|nr:hypothetical protein [Tunicatimonas pelagia]WKN43243.1 hypothetical protein P0M28_29815 [Tunicatimonas pelagia]
MKRVLIITYYWPPAGGISVHRSLKFAKYLPQFGWEPVIYTAKNAQYPYLDQSNFKDIHEETTVVKHPIIEPFGLFKLLSGRKKDESLNNIVHVRNRKHRWIDDIGIWVRGNFFIPDARSLWVRPSVKFLTKYVKENPVDAIFSDGPPHTNTRIATLLHQKTGIPFLADFQDPWTQVDYYPLMKLTSWADQKHRRMEQEAFEAASKMTIASPTWKNDLEKIGAENVDVLYWGYDGDDFNDIKYKLDQSFTITHAGLIGFDRLPEVFFQALAELCTELEGFSQYLQIQLVGQIDYSVVESYQKYGLSSYVKEPGIISRDETLQIIVSSQILLLLLNQAKNAQGRVPGKLFEYLKANRPILCLGPTNSDVAKIIHQTERGLTAEYSDKNAIIEYIAKLFNKFRENRSAYLTSDISEYSVLNQTKKLASHLTQITNQ